MKLANHKLLAFYLFTLECELYKNVSNSIVDNFIGLTQELSKTLLTLCTLCPLRFVLS
jgi:hypothetical protein